MISSALVPGPSTYWSKPGRRRTVCVGEVPPRSSTSSASMNVGSPSTSTVASRSPKAANQLRTAAFLEVPRVSQASNRSGVAGP
jgi:hypothetical protein